MRALNPLEPAIFGVPQRNLPSKTAVNLLTNLYFDYIHCLFPILYVHTSNNVFETSCWSNAKADPYCQGREYD